MIVDGRFGPMQVFADGDLISDALRRYGEWSQLELDFLAPFVPEGGVVIDAGAFIGTHSRCFAQWVGTKGRVLAYEANPATFEVLEHNAGLAPHGNVRACNLALGSRAGRVSIHMPTAAQPNAGASSIGVSGGGRVEVDMIRLDAQGLECADLLKIDVEGMEFDVLSGAERLVTGSACVVFAESNSVDSGAKLLGWARCQGWSAYGLLSPAYNPANFRNESLNVFGGAQEVGILLCPPPRAELLEGHLRAFRAVPLKSLDDLCLLMLHKQQYLEEVQAQTSTAKVLGLDYETNLARELVVRLNEVNASRSAESASYTDQVEQLRNEVHCLEDAMSALEQLSLDRLTLAERLQRQLDEVVAAFAKEELRSVERLGEAERLQSELDGLHKIFASEQTRSVERLDKAEHLQRELEALQKAFASEEARSVERLENAERLQQRLDTLEEVFAKEEVRSIERLHLAEQLQQALDAAFELQQSRHQAHEATIAALAEESARVTHLNAMLASMSELLDLQGQVASSQVADIYAADQQVASVRADLLNSQAQVGDLASQIEQLRNRSIRGRVESFFRNRLPR